jgi:DNA-binding MarR family transcriptional regulator
LEIGQAVVHQVVTHGAVQAQGVVEAAPARPFALFSADLTPAEKQQLTLLRQRLSKLSGFQRRVLGLLASHEGASMNVTQIAAWLYVQEKTVQSQPPQALVRIGLIERSKGARGAYRYASRLRQHLRQHFPRLDPELLAQHLLAELAERK